MKTARCLSCDSIIEIGSKADIEQYVFCEFCGAEFKVLAVNPIELGFVFDTDEFDYEEGEDEGYDYDDDDNDDDDDDERKSWR